jgi:hypothetical protein
VFEVVRNTAHLVGYSGMADPLAIARAAARLVYQGHPSA